VPWFNVDDGFPEHPKLEKLEGEPLKYMAASTVWLMMGADCTRRLTDGVVSVQRLRKVLHHLGKHALLGAEALVLIGLWERHVEGFRYHDWREYQQSRAEVKRKRRLKTERQRRWRDSVDAPSGHSRDAPVGALGGARVDAPVDAPVDASTPPCEGGAVDASPHARAPAGGIQSDPIQSDPREREGPTLTLVSVADPRLSELVRTRFERRFVAATTSPPSWSKKNRDNCQLIATWLEHKGGDHGRILDQVLDGFFREPWARSKGFPLTLLANDPTKFFRPPEGLRDVSAGFVAPAPSSAFVPTSPESVFGPEPKK
jgi:hypothetical protein